MKKLISLLSVLTITGTAMPNVIAATHFEKNNDYEIYEAYAPIKEKNTKNWCSISVLQAIYKKLKNKIISLEKISQDIIFKQSGERGIEENYNILNFLNKIVDKKYEYKMDIINTKYFDTDNKNKVINFQNKIKESIKIGAPIVINYILKYNSEFLPHSSIIDKIEVNKKDYKKTLYWITEPNSGKRIQFNFDSLEQIIKVHGMLLFYCSKKEKSFYKNKIEKKINLKWKKWGPITNDEFSERKIFKLFKWSDYADSWEEFKKIYKNFKFKNFVASAGGQGNTILNNNFIQDTIDIPSENESYTLNVNKVLANYEYTSYLSPIIIISWPTNQKATLKINSFYVKGEYLYMIINSYTKSELAFWNSWTNLEIGEIEFY